MNKTFAFTTLALLTAISGDFAADPLAFSDPANVAPPPSHAIGFPSRDANLDALPGFRKPPLGYGEVAFYWWLGDPLTKERLAWQIEQLDKVKGVMGLQINYAHSDRGGRSYGLTYPSEPPLFSEPWWKLAGWFMQEAKRHGMAISLSDYTLGIGQGWTLDDVLKENPDLAGSVLQQQIREVGAGEVKWQLQPETVTVVAYRLDNGNIVPGSAVDLRDHVVSGVLKWRAPGPLHRLVAVVAKPVQPSLDPMNLKSGPLYAKRFFGQFEDRNPGEGGKGLNFFFSDELGFGIGGNLWTARFAAEFKKRKGYDLLPELPALFQDIGPRTPKVRLDYRDVMVALTEEGFFKPCFDWHQQRGMIFGCDHGGRGRNVVEFGDYFRTQRWNQGPGSDQPGLGRDIIKAKVASSIAHLYERPRVWLEGYYGSGWGTSTEGLTDATFANFAQGYNLLTLHGLYYSTHGGYWEWAPPCNHFRMPYWAHMDRFMACVQRLGYLLSQGHHRCDVALLYPVAPTEAGLGGNEAVKIAFDAGRDLYAGGIDFDFMDFESLARAKVEDRELRVSGERYRVLVLPAMRAVRWSTLQKALEFKRAGGLVFALGAVPEASDRAGRDDAELDAAVKELFGGGENVLQEPKQLVARMKVNPAFPPDFAAQLVETNTVHFMHRKVGPRDVYAVYGVPRDTECVFRATGRIELWDPWTGATKPLRAVAQAETTRLRMPLTEKEMQLIVFSPGQPLIAAESRAEAQPSTIPLDGDWEFELQPTMDNRFGDYHWPPTPGLIGAEVRQFRYADETAPNPGWQKPDFNDSKWQKVTHSFGPRFWKLSPLPRTIDEGLEARLAGLTAVDSSAPFEVLSKRFFWQPYEFSWRWGAEGDPGHQGYHGLKENVTDEFLCLGARKAGRNEFKFAEESGGARYYLWTAVIAERDCVAHALIGGIRPATIWLNGARCTESGGALALNRGANSLLLCYDAPGRGYFVVSTGPRQETGAADDAGGPFSAAASWIWYPEKPVTCERWFRKTFDVWELPARARLRITCDNSYIVSINGRNIGRGNRWESLQEYDVTRQLRPGRNVIDVHAINFGDSAGLIAELFGDGVRVGTDATWLCAKSETAAADDWVPALVVSNYPDSLWAKHKQGPPKLEAVAETPAAADTMRPASKPAPLEMRWFGDKSVLTFDTRPRVAQPAGWYRFRAAPGLRGMTVPVAGTVRAWVDGKEVRGQRLKDGGQIRFELPEPAKRAPVVALRIEQQRGCYGGAALPEPITQDCVTGTIEAGDWALIDGLNCYSGGARYRKTVKLTPEQARGGVTLDFGKVVSSAEVRVNGQLAGVCVSPPWRVDISKHVKPGPNRIEVLVYNTLANHYLTIPTRYRGEPTSGLLGPVALELTASK